MPYAISFCVYFFFNDTSTTEIYTLSLHDALPICVARTKHLAKIASQVAKPDGLVIVDPDRKSTRLNSSHSQISYAVFCLKKKTAIRILPFLNGASFTCMVNLYVTSCGTVWNMICE